MKTARQLSIFLLVVSSMAALYGGWQMISDPTGNSLGFPFYLLNGSVFSDYSLPGWVVLFTVGVFSAVIIFGIVRKIQIYSFLIMLQGVIICIIIFLQMLLLSETFMIQYVFLILAIALIGLGALQNQRKIAVENAHKAHPQPAPKSQHHKHRKHK